MKKVLVLVALLLVFTLSGCVDDGTEFNHNNYYTQEEVDEYKLELEQRIEELENQDFSLNLTEEELRLMLVDALNDTLTDEVLFDLVDMVLDEHDFYYDLDETVEDVIEEYFEAMLIALIEELEAEYGDANE